MPRISPPPLHIYLLGGFRVEQAERRLGESDWPRRKAAQAAILSGRLDTAADHFTQACALMEGAGDDIELARVHQVAAQLNWHRENGREAFVAAQHSLRIAERLGSPTDMAQAYSLLAIACHSLGEWQQGIDYDLKRQSIHGAVLDATESFDAYY